MGDADHMSNEITGNTAKEKSLDSIHIRSIVVLAMFSFVFLGTEFSMTIVLRKWWMQGRYFFIRA